MEKNNKGSDLELSSPGCALKGKLIGQDMEEFDDILEFVGSKGPYQRFLLYGAVVPICFIIAFLSYITIFTLFIPDHHCSPGVEMESNELEQWKLKYIPKEIGADKEETFSSCKIFNYTIPGDFNSNKTTIDCQSGWVYDKKDFDSTIPSDFNWVCQKDFYPTQIFTIYSAGTFIGNVIFGPLADKYGRKSVLFICLFLNVIFALVSLFVVHIYYAFMTCILISSIGFPMVYTVPPLLMAELCDNAYRSWTYTAGWLAWVSGMVILPWIAYFIRAWFTLSLVFITPALLIFVIIAFLPESPRWLISSGRVNEAAAILRTVAKMNGTSDKITDGELVSILQKISELEQEKEKKTLGFWTLFSSRRLTMITVLSTICCATTMMIYEQITLNTPYMSGNQFLNFFILGAVELPGSLAAGYLIRTLGRRWTPVIFGLFMAIVCLVAAVVPTSMTLLIICCIMLAKFGVTITCYVVLVQQTELFPTPLRVTASAVISTIGSVFGLLNASIVYTGRIYSGAPYLCMFGLATLGAICASFLPETLDQHLPETVEDTEDFGKDNKYWSIHPNYNRKLRKSLRRASQVSQIHNVNLIANSKA